MNRLTLAKYRFCYLGLLPIFVIYWILRLEPIGKTFYLSFHDWHLIRPLKPWVGLENYRELLNDPNFLMALYNTTVFAVAVVVLREGARFDGAALYAHLERHLPRYARPAFVRIVPAIDVTGTQKQRKTALVDEGYDPARVADALYVRDDDTATYQPLTSERLAAVTARRSRL